MKYPETPEEIAQELEEWYDSGKRGLNIQSFCRGEANPAAQAKAEHWYEKGRARLNGLIGAIRRLE